MRKRPSSLTRYLTGQSLVEYGVIAGLVSLLAIPALAILAQNLDFSFTGMLASAPTATSKASAGAGGTSHVSSTEEAFDKSLVKPNPKATAPADALATTIDPDDLINAIQVSGALGDGENALASANLLTKFGDALQISDPELANKVVELGLLGKEIAEGIRKCQGCDQGSSSEWYSDEQLELSQKIHEFMDFWNTEVARSSNYQALSDQDKLILSVLTHQTKTIGTNQTQVDYHAKGTKGLNVAEAVAQLKGNKSDADQVDENSDTTIDCGKNGKCNEPKGQQATGGKTPDDDDDV